MNTAKVFCTLSFDEQFGVLNKIETNHINNIAQIIDDIDQQSFPCPGNIELLKTAMDRYLKQRYGVQVVHGDSGLIESYFWFKFSLIQAIQVAKNNNIAQAYAQLRSVYRLMNLIYKCYNKAGVLLCELHDQEESKV